MFENVVCRSHNHDKNYWIFPSPFFTRHTKNHGRFVVAGFFPSTVNNKNYEGQKIAGKAGKESRNFVVLMELLSANFLLCRKRFPRKETRSRSFLKASSFKWLGQLDGENQIFAINSNDADLNATHISTPLHVKCYARVAESSKVLLELAFMGRRKLMF